MGDGETGWTGPGAPICALNSHLVLRAFSESFCQLSVTAPTPETFGGQRLCPTPQLSSAFPSRVYQEVVRWEGAGNTVTQQVLCSAHEEEPTAAHSAPAGNSCLP